MNLVEIIPKDNYRLFLRYDDGTQGELDLSAYVGRGVFKAWLNPSAFKQVKLTEYGNPEWPGEIDLCPDALYMQLTGKKPEEIYPKLSSIPTHA